MNLVNIVPPRTSTMLLRKGCAVHSQAWLTNQGTKIRGIKLLFIIHNTTVKNTVGWYRKNKKLGFLFVSLGFTVNKLSKNELIRRC